jgi:hypothetical protein
MKIKPIRDEIRSINPMQNLGTNLLDIVRTTEPDTQGTYNKLLALAEREKSNRDKLEAQRIQNKVSLASELIRKDILGSKEAAVKGDPYGNLLTTKEMDKNWDNITANLKKKYGMGETGYFKNDPSAYSVFESNMYGAFNEGHQQIEMERKRKILMETNHGYERERKMHLAQLDTVSLDKFSQAFHVHEQQFKAIVDKFYSAGGNIDPGQEMNSFKLEAAKTFLRRAYIYETETGEKLPDYVKQYIAIEGLENFEKIFPNGIKGGEKEREDLEKVLPVDKISDILKSLGITEKNELLSDLSGKVKEQLYIRSDVESKHNAKVIEDYKQRLYREGKYKGKPPMTFKELEKFKKQVVGYEADKIREIMQKDMIDVQEGKSVVPTEFDKVQEILALTATGGIKSINQKFLLSGEDVARSIVDRMRDSYYLNSTEFVTKFEKMKKLGDSNLRKFIEKKVKDDNMLDQFFPIIAKGKNTMVNISPYKNYIIAEAVDQAMLYKEQADREGLLWDNNNLFTPGHRFYLFTDDFINTNKMGMGQAIKILTDQINTAADPEGSTTFENTIERMMFVGKGKSKMPSNKHNWLKKYGWTKEIVVLEMYLKRRAMNIDPKDWAQNEHNLSRWRASKEYEDWAFAPIGTYDTQQDPPPSINKQLEDMSVLYGKNVVIQWLNLQGLTINKYGPEWLERSKRQ